MTDWIMWLALAGVLVILEMFSGTFYLLMIAAGLLAGALAAWAGLDKPQQTIVAALVGIAATYVLRRSKYGKRNRVDAARDPNVNLDIGQVIQIDAWNAQDNPATARAMYRGARWDIQLAPGGEPHPGSFIIREIRGSCLIVLNQTPSKS